MQVIIHLAVVIETHIHKMSKYHHKSMLRIIAWDKLCNEYNTDLFFSDILLA